MPFILFGLWMLFVLFGLWMLFVLSVPKVTACIIAACAVGGCFSGMSIWGERESS
jgi:hypothetical protein